MDLFRNRRNGQKGSTSVIEVTMVRWDFELGNSQTILAESREAEKELARLDSRLHYAQSNSL